MVFARSFKRILSAPKQGEIALTLTVLSLITMLVGTVIGLNRQTPQDVRTSAAGGVQCGATGCSKNSDCSQAAGFLVLCHLASGQCRPALAKDSCPGVTARVGGGTDKKDVGGACITASDCKSGLACPQRFCIVPTGGSSGGTGGAGGGGAEGGVTGLPPTGAIGSGVGTAFSVLELPCKVEFTFRWDPQLNSLTITDPDNPANVFTAVNSQRLRAVPNIEGPIGKQITYPSGGSAGIFVSFDPVNDKEIRITINGGGGGKDTVGSYYFKMPDWMIGSARYRVDITYEGKVAGEKRQWSQQARAKICTNVTPTVTPTTTQTPTPAIECGKVCTIPGEVQCKKHALGQPNCRYRQYGEITNPKMYCLLPGNDSLECKPSTTTSGTPTPSTTATPTATKTPTPTATPTATPTVTQPPRCYKSVYFMIDTSSTQQKNIKPEIERPLNGFFSGKVFKDVTFSYDTFNIIAPRQSGGPANETIQFSLADDQNWTNLNAAFEVIMKRKDDVKILISDGIPSALSPFNNIRANNPANTPLQCVY
ncbi:MAG: hypothetical protein WBO77_04860, partial [Microgenomates group bacterium]